MKIGVTATRKGLSPYQKLELRSMLLGFDATELHHGDCLGGDSDAHDIARELGLRIVGHPPSNPTHRAFRECDELREEKPYLARNRDIVVETKVLLAFPSGPETPRGSGTWATTRFALSRRNHDVTITYPTKDWRYE